MVDSRSTTLSIPRLPKLSRFTRRSQGGRTFWWCRTWSPATCSQSNSNTLPKPSSPAWFWVPACQLFLQAAPTTQRHGWPLQRWPPCSRGGASGCRLRLRPSDLSRTLQCAKVSDAVLGTERGVADLGSELNLPNRDGFLRNCWRRAAIRCWSFG